MYDDTADTAGPQWVWRSVHDRIIFLRVDDTLLVLQLGVVSEMVRQVLILAICSELRPELGLAKVTDLPVQLTRHLAIGVHTSQLRYLGVHLARVLDHLLHGELDLADDVICSVPVRIPKLDTEIFIGLDQFRTNEKGSGLLPDRVEIVGDDTGAVHWLAIFGESKCNVWIATTVLRSTSVLLAQALSAVDADPQHTESFSVLLYRVALKDSPHVKRHGLGSNIHACRGLDSVVDEIADQR